MNKDKIIKESKNQIANALSHKSIESELNIPSIGFGTLRSSGTWILLMLMAEDSEYRKRIIVDIIEKLEISIDDLRELQNDKACDKCGMSIRLHKDNEGICL